MLNLQAAELRELLEPCLAVPRWVEEVVAAAPYATADALIAKAREAATPLSANEIAEALVDHPRIGEKPVGQGAAQDFSRREQASLDASDESVAAAIAAGNAAYESRFDRVFLIRAKGRSRTEILAELHRRLDLDDETDLRIAGSELADIAILRLESSLAARVPTRSHITSHVLDSALGTPASGVSVDLDQWADGEWMPVASALTDDDGRVTSLGPVALPAGSYRVTFDTAAYFGATGQPVFYPSVSVSFVLADASQHYHVPLLLSPFAYSTYRGS